MKGEIESSENEREKGTERENEYELFFQATTLMFLPSRMKRCSGEFAPIIDRPVLRGKAEHMQGHKWMNERRMLKEREVA